jgi:putative inorganic carbon (HCO3(-)) transporter
MAQSIQSRLDPSALLMRPPGRMIALAFGVAGAGLAALFVDVHWSAAVVGAPVILALSAAESEPFLLLMIFLLPVGWFASVGIGMPGAGAQFARFDLATAARLLVVAGFFAGRLWRGQLGARWLLEPFLTRGSLAIWAVALISVLFSATGLTHGSTVASVWLASYLGFYFFVLAWVNSRVRLEKVLAVVLASTVVVGAFGVLQEILGGYTKFWLYLNQPPEDFAAWDNRVTSFLHYSTSLAGYLNLALPLALACCVVGKGKWRKLGASALGLGFVALLCTQSIGGLIAFGCVLMLAIFRLVSGWRRRLFLLVGFCVLVLGFYVVREVLNPAHAGQSVVGHDAAIRVLLWGVAWDLFVHSPIFGVGWGNFVELYGPYLSSFSFIPPGVFAVHNLYLQFLTETGLIGFLTFSSLIFLATREAWRQMAAAGDSIDRALSFGVLGALATVLVHGVVDFLFSVSPPFGTLFWTLLALLVANGYIRSGRDIGRNSVRRPAQTVVAP